jgi:hypothetical protein
VGVRGTAPGLQEYLGISSLHDALCCASPPPLPQSVRLCLRRELSPSLAGHRCSHGAGLLLAPPALATGQAVQQTRWDGAPAPCPCRPHCTQLTSLHPTPGVMDKEDSEMQSAAQAMPHHKDIVEFTQVGVAVQFTMVGWWLRASPWPQPLNCPSHPPPTHPPPNVHPCPFPAQAPAGRGQLCQGHHGPVDGESQ